MTIPDDIFLLQFLMTISDDNMTIFDDHFLDLFSTSDLFETLITILTIEDLVS